VPISCNPKKGRYCIYFVYVQDEIGGNGLEEKNAGKQRVIINTTMLLLKLDFMIQNTNSTTSVSLLAFIWVTSMSLFVIIHIYLNCTIIISTLILFKIIVNILIQISCVEVSSCLQLEFIVSYICLSLFAVCSLVGFVRFFVAKKREWDLKKVTTIYFL
jgi:hypothetical protein